MFLEVRINDGTCLEDNIPLPDNSTLIYVEEDKFAIFICKDGYKMDQRASDVIWCQRIAFVWIPSRTKCTSEYIL